MFAQESHMKNIGIVILAAGVLIICGCRGSAQDRRVRNENSFRYSKSFAMAQVIVAATRYADEHDRNWPDTLGQVAGYIADPNIDLQAYEYHKPPMQPGGPGTETTVMLIQKLTEFGGGELTGFVDSHVEFSPLNKTPQVTQPDGRHAGDRACCRRRPE
jgi:hypothetical protein